MLRNKRSEMLADLALGKLPPEEALRLFEEAERNPRVLENLDLHIALADLAASEKGGVFQERGRREKSKVWNGLRDIWGHRTGIAEPRLVYAFGLLCFAVLVSTVLIWRGFQVEPYHLLASVSESEVEFRTRSLVGKDLAPAVTLFSSERFEEGVQYLERYLQEHPGSELSAYLHYSAGLGCLIAAKSTLLGLYVNYDTLLVRRSFNHFTLALSDSSGYGLEDEARFYRAKASLILGDVNWARRDLQRVVSGCGTLSDGARSLLKGVSAVQGRGM